MRTRVDVWEKREIAWEHVDEVRLNFQTFTIVPINFVKTRKEMFYFLFKHNSFLNFSVQINRERSAILVISSALNTCRA